MQIILTGETMTNYQKELENIIEDNKKRGVKPTLLLHACCAPCSSYCLYYLKDYFKTEFLNANFIFIPQIKIVHFKNCVKNKFIAPILIFLSLYSRDVL